MRKLKLVLGICAIGTIAAVSCKKKSNNTATDQLVGKWKVTQTAEDLNNNGTVDADELITDTTNSYFTFNSGGTGSASEDFAGAVLTFPFSWVYVGGKSYVQVTLVDTTFGSTQVTSLHIDNISSSAMTLKDTTGGIADWTIFAKQ